VARVVFLRLSSHPLLSPGGNTLLDDLGDFEKRLGQRKQRFIGFVDVNRTQSSASLARSQYMSSRAAPTLSCIRGLSFLCAPSELSRADFGASRCDNYAAVSTTITSRDGTLAPAQTMENVHEPGLAFTVPWQNSPWETKEREWKCIV